jgi:hypothetical protein
VYIEGKPAAFSLGSSAPGAALFCTHFEKADDSYQGIFQYVNQQQARALSEHIMHINREQDVGDEGLRQAKMTYRPEKFVVKYLVTKKEASNSHFRKVIR